MLRSITVTILLGLAVCACGVPDTALSPQLNSGVTSSNGGGTRTLGNVNTQSVGPAGTMPSSSSTKGNAL